MKIHKINDCLQCWIQEWQQTNTTNNPGSITLTLPLRYPAYHMSVSVINFNFDLGCFKTQRNKCCVFPFWYEGKEIYSCIRDNNIWPWCATTDNYTKDHLWDNCAGKLRAVQWTFLLQAVFLLLKRLNSSCRLYYYFTNNPK